MNLGLNLSDNNFLGSGNRFNLASIKVFIKKPITYHSLIPISQWMVSAGDIVSITG